MNSRIRPLIALLASLALLPGCGNEESAEMKTIPIDFSVEEKTILVNSFANLTDNSDLNLFEDGVSTLIEESLTRMPGVKIIPRRSVNKLVAVSDADTMMTIGELARQKGVDYVIDGWISRHKDEYRIYANLLEVATGHSEKKAAVATFETRDEAVVVLDGFVNEIATKVGLPRSEMEATFTNSHLDYDIFSLQVKAVASYYKGRPDVAVSLLEQALILLEEQNKSGEHEHLDDSELYKSTGRLHFLLAQIHTELGNYAKVEEHLRVITPHASSFRDVSRRSIVAMNHEVAGEYGKARAIYTKLTNAYPHEQYFYTRLARMILKDGGSLKQAVNVLERGANLNPEDTRLHREIARLQLKHDSTGDVEQFAVQTLEEDNMAAGNEVVSELVNYRVKNRFVKNMPTEVIYLNGDSEDVVIESIDVGPRVDLKKLEQNLDFSCPNTTSHAFRLAAIAISSGEPDLARRIADLVAEHGDAENSEATYSAIYSMLHSSQGEFKQAKELAMQIEDQALIKYITWAHLLAHAGKYDKAVELLEKAERMTSGKDPLILKSLVDTLWLAGDYQRWGEYNQKLLELSEELEILSPGIRAKMVLHWNEKYEEGTRRKAPPSSPLPETPQPQ